MFKKIERVEANMCVLCGLDGSGLARKREPNRPEQAPESPLKLYPEDRDAPHSTTPQILKTSAGISSYAIEVQPGRVEEYRDELKPVHLEVLALLDIEEERFWRGKRPLAASR